MRTAARLFVLLVFLGCSAIPDVVFSDREDAGGPTNDGGADGGAGSDGSVDQEAGLVDGPEPPADGPLGCPNNPPLGIKCCDVTPCVGCNEQNLKQQCESCNRHAPCNPPNVCCPKTQGQVECRQACN